MDGKNLIEVISKIGCFARRARKRTRLATKAQVPIYDVDSISGYQLIGGSPSFKVPQQSVLDLPVQSLYTCRALSSFCEG
jgi:hypothetical protein